jgi:hypothetical protein
MTANYLSMEVPSLETRTVIYNWVLLLVVYCIVSSTHFSEATNLLTLQVHLGCLDCWHIQIGWLIWRNWLLGSDLSKWQAWSLPVESWTLCWEMRSKPVERRVFCWGPTYWSASLLSLVWSFCKVLSAACLKNYPVLEVWLAWGTLTGGDSSSWFELRVY